MVRQRVAWLVLVLAMVAAACGGNGGTEAGTEAPTEPAGTAGEPTPADTPDEGTEAAADFDLGVDTITIGLINPYSGPFGFFGQFVENSIQIEVDKINAAGGLGGAQLAIERRDMELNPQLAVQAATEFATDPDVQLVIGPPFTGFFNAAKGIFEQNQQVNCAMAVAGGEALDGLRYAFRTQDPDQFRTVALLDYLVEQEGIESIAIVYEDDDTGRGYDQVYSQLAPEKGVEYLGFQATRPDDQTHTAQVDAVKDADAIIISSNSTNAAKTAVAAEEVGYEGLLVGFSGLQGWTYVEGAGEAADGTIFAANYLAFYTDPPEDEWLPGYREHVNEVIERFGVTTGPNSGVEQYSGTTLAADCVVFFAEAVRHAQSLEPDAIVEGWEQINMPVDVTPSGVNAVFGPDDHEAYGPDDLYIYEWVLEDGEWKLEELARGQQG